MTKKIVCIFQPINDILHSSILSGFFPIKASKKTNIRTVNSRYSNGGDSSSILYISEYRALYAISLLQIFAKR